MTRSVWKGPFFNKQLLKKVENVEKNSIKKKITVWSRKSVILPQFIGHSFEIHNGYKFIPLFINDSMIGHKFGEFAITRKPCVFKKKKKEKTFKK